MDKLKKKLKKILGIDRPVLRTRVDAGATHTHLLYSLFAITKAKRPKVIIYSKIIFSLYFAVCEREFSIFSAFRLKISSSGFSFSL